MSERPTAGQRSLDGPGVQEPRHGDGRLNVVVTAGGTIAPVDDVRLLSNVSSGRFGAAITEAWLGRGANVWHIQTPTAAVPFLRHAQFDLDAQDPVAEQERLGALQDRWNSVRDRLHLTVLPTGTIAEYQQTLENVLKTERIDVAMLAMAVSDFEPIPVAGKIGSDSESLTIHCRRTPKVIRAVRDWAPGVYLAGFKLLSCATHEELVTAAELACKTNRADLTVANDLQTVRAGQHTVHLVRPGFELVHQPEDGNARRGKPGVKGGSFGLRCRGLV
jgi:phosphopantothenate-cysteine ligase